MHSLRKRHWLNLWLKSYRKTLLSSHISSNFHEKIPSIHLVSSASSCEQNLLHHKLSYLKSQLCQSRVNRVFISEALAIIHRANRLLSKHLHSMRLYANSQRTKGLAMIRVINYAYFKRRL